MSSQSFIFNPKNDRLAAAGVGFQIPRLTTEQRLALSVNQGDAGMLVFDVTLLQLFQWSGFQWVSKTSITPANVGMLGIPGVGMNLVAAADSRMTLGWTGYNNWGFVSNVTPLSTTFQSVTFGSGLMNITLKPAPAGQQSISLSGTRMLNNGVLTAGRYLVSLDVRCSGGTAVELYFGKSQVDANSQIRFTPTGTLTTYRGWIESNGAGSSMAIGLSSNNASNGSTYEVTNVQIYFVGNADIDNPPYPADAPDESAEFTELLQLAADGDLDIVFEPRRYYKVSAGGFTAKSGIQIDLNGSQLHFDSLGATYGIMFASDGAIRNGILSSTISATGSDKGLIQCVQAQNQQPYGGLFEAEHLVIDHDIAGGNFGILVLGSLSSRISDIWFKPTASTRRLIGAVWSGPANTLGSPTDASLGNHPSINTLIENIYAETSLQGFPAVGGGAVVSVNGCVNCTIRNVYGELVGRSLVSLGSGDWGDTQFEGNLRNSGLQGYLVENCACVSNSIGFRAGGTPYLTTTSLIGMNVRLVNCSTVQVAGVHNDAGFRFEGSLRKVVVDGCYAKGHINGVASFAEYADGTGSGVVNEAVDVIGSFITDSQEEGIVLNYVRNGLVADNRIYDSGTDLTAGKRSGIHLQAGCQNIVIRDNRIGRSGEATTSQNAGIVVDSDATITLVSVHDNIISGAAAAGTPLSLGALATYSLRGNNYTGTGIIEVNDRSAAIAQSPDFLIAQALGSPILGQTYGATPMSNLSSVYTLADFVFAAVAAWVPRDCTITGVKYILGTSGSYMPDSNNRIGLYTYSGGTLTLVASCANDGALWSGAADTLLTKAFSSTYAATAGLYFIGFTSNWLSVVTAPALKSAPAIGMPVGTLDYTNSAKIFAAQNAIYSDLPASVAMSALPIGSRLPFFMLY